MEEKHYLYTGHYDCKAMEAKQTSRGVAASSQVSQNAAGNQDIPGAKEASKDVPGAKKASKDVPAAKKASKGGSDKKHTKSHKKGGMRLTRNPGIAFWPLVSNTHTHAYCFVPDFTTDLFTNSKKNAISICALPPCRFGRSKYHH